MQLIGSRQHLITPVVLSQTLQIRQESLEIQVDENVRQGEGGARGGHMSREGEAREGGVGGEGK